MTRQLELFPGERTPEAFLAALRARGVRGIAEVRFKENRTRLLAVSRDGSTLHAHAAYAAAPSEVLDAIATFLRRGRGRAAYAEALRVLRGWPGAVDGLRAAALRKGGGRSPAPGRCCATEEQRAFLRRLYARINRERFGGRLPADLPLRFSDRMLRRFGHVRYWRNPAGERHVVELALNAALLHRANEHFLLDTLVHEMAHVEAWLTHGHGGHGAEWKRICARVGCEPKACTAARIAPRRGHAGGRIPEIPLDGAA